jgi:hypothetical protein
MTFDNWLHLGLQSVSNQPGRHDDGRYGAHGTKSAGAMLADLEADYLAVVDG